MKVCCGMSGVPLNQSTMPCIPLNHSATATRASTFGRCQHGFRHWPGKSKALGYTGILVIDDQLTKIVIYLPSRTIIDSPQLTRMLFEHMIYMHSLPEHCIALTWPSITKFQLPFIHNQPAKWSTKSRLLNNTYLLSATKSKITGLNYYFWRNWGTTTPCKLGQSWPWSGLCIISIPICSLWCQKQPASWWRPKQMSCLKDEWKLTGSSNRTCSWRKRNSQCLLAWRRSGLQWEKECGSRRDTSTHTDIQRNSTTTALDYIR